MYQCRECDRQFIEPGWDCDGYYCPKCQAPIADDDLLDMVVE